MSLDTVLKIGEALRASEDHLKHFKYVKPCPPDTDKETILRLNIPVKEDFSFDWDNVSIITNENEIKDLYYLTFKTSNSDSSIKYLFGDLFYAQETKVNKKTGIISNTTEGGVYRLFKKNTFFTAEKDFENIKNGLKTNLLKNVLNEKGIKIPFEKTAKEFIKWKNTEKYIIPKALIPSKNLLIKIFKKVDEQNPLPTLSRFRKSFQTHRELIEKILLNITAINEFFSESNNITLKTLFEDDDKLKRYNIRRIKNNLTKNVLKIVLASEETNDLNSNQENKLLKIKNGKIFIHFDFGSNKHWYNFKEEFMIIKSAIFQGFAQEIQINKNMQTKEFVLNKTLYKTLCSGDSKNDIQFPSFNSDNKFKSRSFSKNEIDDLFYAINYSETGLINVFGTDIKIIVLPHGENLVGQDYIDFLENRNEQHVINANINNEEPLFIGIENEDEQNITSFDFIFSKRGGLSSPDVDLLELSGIEKSTLKATKDRIRKIAREVHLRKIAEINTTKNLLWPTISRAYINILGNPQKDKSGKVNFKVNPRYNTHILKVLPKIYTQNYKTDPILLPALIRNVEFSIREGDSKFIFLKYDIEFLLKIQNTKIDKFMELAESNSFKIGALLGSLAKNFSGKNTPINSFEKNYVGNLSRRIGTLEDFVKLKNDIEQKLIMHEKTQFTFSTSNELSQLLKEFKGRYDKEACAFGFFDSYFKPNKKQTLFEKLEKVIGQNIDSDSDKEMLGELKNIIKNYNVTE